MKQFNQKSVYINFINNKNASVLATKLFPDHSLFQNLGHHDRQTYERFFKRRICMVKMVKIYVCVRVYVQEIVHIYIRTITKG